MKNALPFAALVLLAGCAFDVDRTGDDVATKSAALTGPKVGVLFASYGDVDSAEEVEPFVKKTLRDPDVAPIPNWLRPLVVEIGWALDGKNILAEYAAIGGGTQFRARTRDQADRVAEALRSQGVNAYGYIGFDFAPPFIGDTLAQMQADKVEKLVLIYEGAQYSKVTQWINIRETKKYLSNHPEWRVDATAIKSFSDDPRFLQLLGDSIELRVQSDFASAPADKLCVMLPMHGVPTYLPENGDPAIDQMMRAVDYLRARFPAYLMEYGFQNHDEFPFSKWTQPGHDDVIESLASNPRCENIIINGRVSFTVDSLETLYDYGVDEMGVALGVNPEAKVFVEPMFNSEPTFIDLMAQLTNEALAGQGDIEVMRKVYH